MNPIIKSNERITYLRDLPSAVALHDYIQELDAKYNVDSSDSDNSFGRTALDEPISVGTHGLDNTLYFAKISTSGFFSEEDLLPKHEQIPPANYAIGIDKNGNTVMFESAAHAMAERKPITIDEDDLVKLRELRKTFQVEVEANAPEIPPFIKRNDIIDPADFFQGRVSDPKPFKDLPLVMRQHICDVVYTKAGFANTPFYKVNIDIPITYTETGKPKDTFNVKYYRLDPNTHYYFATSYKGWQNQEEMPHDHPCYAFWKKWNIFHTTTMTVNEWHEMRDDLKDIAGQASDLESVMPHMVRKLADCDIALFLYDKLEDVFGEAYFDDLLALILKNLAPDAKTNRNLETKLRNPHERAYTTSQPITFRGKTFTPKLVIDTHNLIIVSMDI